MQISLLTLLQVASASLALAIPTDLEGFEAISKRAESEPFSLRIWNHFNSYPHYSGALYLDSESRGIFNQSGATTFNMYHTEQPLGMVKTTGENSKTAYLAPTNVAGIYDFKFDEDPSKIPGAIYKDFFFELAICGQCLWRSMHPKSIDGSFRIVPRPAEEYTWFVQFYTREATGAEGAKFIELTKQPAV